MTSDSHGENTGQSEPDKSTAVGRLLDSMSVWWLVVLAVGMGLAPWPAGPMPHLIEKSMMLVDGALTRPIDIFDLFVHGLPAVLLAAKLGRRRVATRAADG
jgi:hypothetical protein